MSDGGQNSDKIRQIIVVELKAIFIGIWTFYIEFKNVRKCVTTQQKYRM